MMQSFKGNYINFPVPVFSRFKGKEMVTLISAVRGANVTKSSASTLIPTIYPHCELHLHTLEIPYYSRQCLRVQKFYPMRHHNVQKWVHPMLKCKIWERLFRNEFIQPKIVIPLSAVWDIFFWLWSLMMWSGSRIYQLTHSYLNYF